MSTSIIIGLKTKTDTLRIFTSLWIWIKSFKNISLERFKAHVLNDHSTLAYLVIDVYFIIAYIYIYILYTVMYANIAILYQHFSVMVIALYFN